MLLLGATGLPARADRKLTIRNHKGTLSEFFKEIEKQSDYRFFYNDELVKIEKGTYQLDVKNESIDEVLNTLLANTGLMYRKLDNNLIVISSRELLQNVNVTGTVVDVNGEPIAGVNISVKGTTTGTATDVDGRFSLDVSQGATLTVSFIGYVSQEIVAGSRTSFRITLLEDMQALEEIVVVGYGTQKKVNLTGAVATLNASEIREIPASNLSNALSGRLGGVTITQNMGGRPGNSSSISIRAKGSWNNTDPLYVIDGVVRDKFAFDGLDANDIENLSVLKDGASAAVYGSRSANGVILITTKKGSVGKPVITYTGTIGMSDATKIPETESAYDHSVFINDALTVQKVPANDFRYFTEDELEYLKTHSYSWMDIGWKEPLLSHHSLNVNGGNERVRYFIGGSYYYETGSFDNMKFTKYNLRGNIEANITKDLVASLNLNTDVRNDRKPFWNNDNDSDNLYDLFGSLLQFASPYIPPYTSDGRPVGNYISNHSLELTRDGYNHRKYSNYEANVSLEYKVPFVQGLSVKLLYNVYNRHQFTKHFTRPFTVYVLRTEGEHNHIIIPDEVASTKQLNARDWINERYDAGDSYQLNAFVTYNRDFGKHRVGALFVYEQAEGFTDWFRGQRNFYISNAVDQLFAGSSDANDSTVDGSGSEDGRLSYVGRLNYGYADKYLVEASFRYDGSVRFAPEQRWGFFPSVSAAWRISEEEFFKNHVRAVNDLKIKGSVALLGNDLVGGWQWMQRYTFTPGAQYGATMKGIQADVVPNPYITWEKSLSYNGGIEAGFLNNKLTAGIDVFYKHTYDVLGSRIASMPSTFGANMPNENYGIVDSRGLELQLGYTDRIGKDFGYYVRGNFAYAANELIKRDEAENLRPYQSQIGLNTDRAMGYIYTDIIRTQEDLDALPEGYTIFGATPELGMMNYKDIRGATSDEPDGKIDSNDQEWVLTHITPPVTYGFSLGADWKGFALDLFFQGVAGNQLYLKPRATITDQAAVNFTIWNDHWTPDHIDASFPRAANHQLQNSSTFMKRNGSFLRLKNVALSYTVPGAVLNKAGIARLKFFLTGTNLFLLEDHVRYFDPEIGNDDNNFRFYPIMKNYSFGVNLSF
jgi:TonB-linked SusC/RagA family outer membrane protein